MQKNLSSGCPDIDGHVNPCLFAWRQSDEVCVIDIFHVYHYIEAEW